MKDVGGGSVGEAGGSLRFTVFGAVRAWRGEEQLDLGAPRQRAVLAMLLLHANRPVARERLIEALWGDPAPAYAVNQLQKYISALRRVLEPGRAARSPSGVLEWSESGYVLRVEPDGLDLAVFERQVGRGREAQARGDAQEAAWGFHEALGLGGGPALANVSSAVLDAERDRLAELRTAVLEERIEADLGLGRHGRLIPELTRLVAEFPLRERLAALLMLALFRAGRQAEALAVYDTTRGVLAEELGIDPGPELQRRHQQILTSDAALDFDVAGAASAVAIRRPSAPRQLPAPPALFTGRGEELIQLSSMLQSHSREGGMVVIAAVGGTGGIGKTYLTLRWAHDHRDDFPDGELYVNLRGFDPSGPPVSTAVALRGFLDALGMDPVAIPDDLSAQIGLYRSMVEGKRMLIVLDNARDTDQVKDLMPGSGTCTVLVTSRSQLAGLVTEHAARSLPLGVLADDDAYELLTRRLGPARVDAEPQATAAILGRCGGLPLALSIVAARAAAQPHLPLTALAAELAESADRLDALNAGEVTADLRAVFSASYEALGPEEARAFALLGLSPGPDISLPAAASLIATTIPRARSLLRTLEAAYLIRQHAPGRYQFHDLVRLFATERAHQAKDDTERRAALRRLADFYLHSAHQAVCQVPARPHVRNLVLEPPASGCSPHRCADVEGARVWFEAEDTCLLATHQLACDQGWHTHGWQLPVLVLTFRSLHGRGLDDMNTWQTAIEAANRLKDPLAQAVTHNAAGTACTDTGRHIRAQTHLQKALHLFEETGNLHGQAHTLHSLGCSWEQQRAPRCALLYHERALLMFRRTGDSRWEANSLNSIGWCHALLGHYDQARRYCGEALTMARTSGDQLREAYILDSLGYIAHHSGHHSSALAYYQQALSRFRVDGSSAEAGCLQHLGDTYLALNQRAAARQAWQQALRVYRAQHRTAGIERLQEHLDALGMQRAIEGE